MSSHGPERSEVLRALMDAMRVLGDRNVLYSEALSERLGLSLTDFKAASVLHRSGPMTAGELAARTGLTTGAVTGLLDRLERAGWVRRVKNPSDRRHVVVEALETPAPKILELVGPVQAHLAESVADFDLGEVQRITEFLTRAADVLSAEAAKLRSGAASAPASAEQAPLNGARRGTLRLRSGASRLTLTAAAPSGLLYQASFGGKPPHVDMENGAAVVTYTRASLLDFRKLPAELALSSEIPWELELTGGTSRLRGELGGLQLAGLSFRGGASDVELALPPPSGVVPLRISGGASKLVLRRPGGVAMRVQVSGGSSALQFDGQHLGSVGGTARLESPGARDAADRYELEISGGASHVTVESR